MAIIEAKLFQQLANIGQVPVFEVFLDLKKAYDTLNRERMLELLQAYGVGDKACTLLARFWEQMQVVARQSGYHGCWRKCASVVGKRHRHIRQRNSVRIRVNLELEE